MVPLKRGTSILGSLTPSESVVEVVTVAGLADRRHLAFREHLYILSLMLFSTFISSLSSGRSSEASPGAMLLSSDFKSAISSSSYRTVHSYVGSVDRVSFTVDSLRSSRCRHLDVTPRLSVKTGLEEGGEVERRLIRHSIHVESLATRSSCSSSTACSASNSALSSSRSTTTIYRYMHTVLKLTQGTERAGK